MECLHPTPFFLSLNININAPIIFHRYISLSKKSTFHRGSAEALGQGRVRLYHYHPLIRVHLQQNMHLHRVCLLSGGVLSITGLSSLVHDNGVIDTFSAVFLHNSNDARTDIIGIIIGVFQRD